MPTHIKVMLSIAVVLIGIGAAWLEREIVARPDVALVVLCLTAFMVVAMWVFPEAGKKDTGARG